MSIRSLATVLTIFTALAAAGAEAQRNSLCRDLEPESHEATIAAEDEPGERLTITGRVLVGGDRQPLAGARLLAFHTDAEGYYSVGGMDERNARLCAVVRTDAEGRYRFETIRPAHYATGGPPAHVHFELSAPGGGVRHFSLNFEGDPLLRGRSGAETWSTVRPIEKAPDGALRVQRDFWLQN